jgi:hypothetical protein
MYMLMMATSSRSSRDLLYDSININVENILSVFISVTHRKRKLWSASAVVLWLPHVHFTRCDCKCAIGTHKGLEGNAY